ncbi:bifunctional methylenetetrahydrofolate dehydrogenase/methenyltetrahydrofolate cyclohydrolase FolD [Aureimonas altamirensis]|uniref:bifunctional methylenetetrahydrofolate dehydrogenase/methenyltetrahydrofolate cyclohydrolase FolD n=1 Tax=Aureimonas altamirensis TaxID=370622 RepID=UPI0020368CF6|nr:bifunctional methylenetetrahydrofolate dehydrogenase/methenyltetrahydrofolate cyclohydrolase FolD [Aureimonas altamirensis]MCM2504672.1 bifunctional methylenetetrahydrofolate dehydrogenase/methenyltetrahydrofolate cyclohydrolase FolD [Aureimonas altamirensis]
MQGKLIDGKAESAKVRAAVAERAAAFSARHGRRPGLAVVLVGNDPASEVYVASKVRLTREAGMESFEHRLAADTAQDDLLALVRRLNADDAVDGILVQLPLPAPLDAGPVILAIDPAKDVDGLHPENAGRLVAGLPGLVPCTPMGAMHLARSVRPRMDGLTAVVIGRSNLVGKPVAQLLLNANATVTMAHSRTQDLASLCRTADILVPAVGRAEMVKGDWIKPGATVIDVGINRLPPAEGQAKGRLVGDVAFDEAIAVAGAITPVPGGVGPMTIAFLLQNTLTAAERRANVTR